MNCMCILESILTKTELRTFTTMFVVVVKSTLYNTDTLLWQYGEKYTRMEWRQTTLTE